MFACEVSWKPISNFNCEPDGKTVGRVEIRENLKTRDGQTDSTPVDKCYFT